MTTTTTNPELPFLLDACEISTKARIVEAFADHPAEYVAHHHLDIREVKQSFKVRKGRKYPWLTFVIGCYGGAKVYASKDEEGMWFIRHVRLNPARLLRGHNGGLLTPVEVGIAFTILVELLQPLLTNPKDSIHLLPGLGGNAHWRSVEIPFHVSGSHFGLFLNARHPGIKSRGLRYVGESLTLGKQRAEVSINFYLKGREMNAKRGVGDLHYKGGSTEEDDILRIEVTLRGNRLLHHLGDTQHSQIIEGVSRLTSFTAETLQRAHWEIVKDLQGCFQIPGGDVYDNKSGRFLALASILTNNPIDFWLDVYTRRFSSSKAATVRLRSAAIDEASRLSTIKVEEVFSDEAYATQPFISVPTLERLNKLSRDNTSILPEIAKAYQIPPPEGNTGRFIPHTTLGS